VIFLLEIEYGLKSLVVITLFANHVPVRASNRQAGGATFSLFTSRGGAMTITRRMLFLLSFLTMTLSAEIQEWRPPTTLRKLPNGLTVVLSEDHNAPTVGLCISYGIGSRLEPVGRSGFAHLFEHMMFEGTPAAPKGIFTRVVESGGGFVNGQTDNDFTQYFESAPVSALDAMLWLEADRMKTLDFSSKNLENQRNVVEEEVRVNVLNQPYGLFYIFDLPKKAFDKYPNAHNAYGDFQDLNAANIDDVHRFYDQYYAPNNAVLAIVGDFSANEVFAKVEKYFSNVSAKPTPPRPTLPSYRRPPSDA
jgi:zinc protease